MIAQPSPFAPGGPMAGMQGGMPQGGMPQGMPQGGMPPQNYQALGSSQKTIVAGMAPPNLGQMMQGQMPPGMQGQMPPGMQGQMPQGTPGAGYPPQPSGPSGANKTILLQPSEGVVSVARAGGSVQAATAGGAPMVEGASTLYWIVCLFTGIAVGVLAYVVYLQV
jgi:hypothetical protein